MKKGRSDCILPDTHAVSLAKLLNKTIVWQVWGMPFICVCPDVVWLVCVFFCWYFVTVLSPPLTVRFDIDIKHEQERQDAFYDYIAHEPVLNQLPQLLVTYEELLADTATTMKVIKKPFCKLLLCYIFFKITFYVFYFFFLHSGSRSLSRISLMITTNLLKRATKIMKATDGSSARPTTCLFCCTT